MAALETQVIHQGSMSVDGSPQRQLYADSQDDLPTSSKGDFQDDSAQESARSANHTALQESLLQLQQQLALKDFILDSLEDIIPSDHLEQARATHLLNAQSCCFVVHLQGKSDLSMLHFPMVHSMPVAMTVGCRKLHSAMPQARSCSTHAKACDPPSLALTHHAHICRPTQPCATQCNVEVFQQARERARHSTSIGEHQQRHVDRRQVIIPVLKRRPCCHAAAQAIERSQIEDARYRHDNILAPCQLILPPRMTIDWLGPDHPSTQVCLLL